MGFECRTVVIEDSRIGMLAAKGAGMRHALSPSNYSPFPIYHRFEMLECDMISTERELLCRCIITKSRYTGGEDFSVADVVFDCIGDAGDERFSLYDLLPTQPVSP